MKTLYPIFALLSCLLTMASARELTFAWDAPTAPVDGYTVYYRTAENPWLSAGEVSGQVLQLKGTFPDQPFEVVVKAFANLTPVEAGRIESAASASRQVPATPAAPEGVEMKISVSFRLKRSTDLAAWTQIAEIKFPEPAFDRAFYQLSN